MTGSIVVADSSMMARKEIIVWGAKPPIKSKIEYVLIRICHTEIPTHKKQRCIRVEVHRDNFAFDPLGIF
jgi:hypothetical protein